MDGLRCLGRTPGYVRYSGYDTAEEEARYLPVLGPVWKYGDPVPPAARADQLKTLAMSTCPQCDQPGIFGYRDKNTGEMTWYCTTHRLGQYWADARRDQSTSPRPDHPDFATSMPSS